MRLATQNFHRLDEKEGFSDNKNGEPLNRRIDRLAIEQERELILGAIPWIDNFSFKEIYDTYTQSQLFYQTYDFAIEETRIQNDMRGFLAFLKGAVFADLAFSVMSYRLYPQEVLLNQRRTNELFEALLVGKIKYKEYPFGNQCITLIERDGYKKRTSNPDGIILVQERGRYRLGGFVEYKTGLINHSRLENQLASYQKRLIEEQVNHPSAVVEKPYTLLVMPALDDQIFPQDIGDAKLEELTFLTRAAIYNLVRKIFWEYTPPYTADGSFHPPTLAQRFFTPHFPLTKIS
jgi:hypothetical protein